MKNLEQKFSGDRLTTSRHETRCGKSTREYSNPVPVDLLIDIFSRVPAKSIGRFRCVSKLWESIFHRSYFTELFPTNSLSRPRLFLFTFEIDKELSVFTSLQPQNPHDNLSIVATRYHKSFPKYFPSETCSPPVCGLVLVSDWRGKFPVAVVYNPVTRESITLPGLEENMGESFLGFDPINKQFKVLCVIWSDYGEGSDTYRVLTLKTEKPSWRRIECELNFYIYPPGEVCINGLLYFSAKPEGCYVIVCFDFRSEKFRFVNTDDQMLLENRCWKLFNYKGKLVAHKSDYIGEQVMLWVREDAEKDKWSNCICVLLPLWDEGFFDNNEIVGMTDTSEIVFSPCYLSNPFYVV